MLIKWLLTRHSCSISLIPLRKSIVAVTIAVHFRISSKFKKLHPVAWYGCRRKFCFCRCSDVDVSALRARIAQNNARLNQDKPL
jgi:hypothetical protein